MNKSERYIVVLIARYALGCSKKDRPAVSIGILGDKHQVFPTSSDWPLADGEPSVFVIDDTDPQFTETGLNRSSYVLDRPAFIDKSDILKTLGVIEGDLKRRMDEEFGL